MYVVAFSLLILATVTRSSYGREYQTKRRNVIKAVNDIKEFPYMAFLIATDEANEAFSCAGTIISSQVVLTAAHCTDQNRFKGKIMMGDVNIFHCPMIRNVAIVKSYEKYDKYSLKHDISLMCTDRPMRFSGAIKKGVLLAETVGPAVEMMLRAVSWGLVVRKVHKSGKIKAKSHRGDSLQYLDQKLLNKQRCEEITKENHDNSMCTLITSSSRDALYGGNSGGALVTRDGVQMGVLSYHETSKGITVYTNVAAYINWIHMNIKALFKIQCTTANSFVNVYI